MRHNNNNEHKKVISLFSGCGGMDLGFHLAGFKSLVAVEENKTASTTFKKNIDGVEVLNGDITNIKTKEILDAANLSAGDVDVVIGGPPCQTFSVAGNRMGTDEPKGKLVWEYFRVVREALPKFFVMENVVGMVSWMNGKVIGEIKDHIEKPILLNGKEYKYKIDFKVLNAANFGVPQNRYRVFIIGNRMDMENPFPKPTHSNATPLFFDELSPYISVKDSIEHLSDVRTRDNPFELNGSTIYNHVANTNVANKFWHRKHKVPQATICEYLKEWKKRSTWTTKKIDQHFGYNHTAGHWFRDDNKSGSIPKPKDWWILKDILGFDDLYDQKVTELELREITFDQSLRISNWDTPSDTITASISEIHPNKKRRLSVRECAIIQTFPNDFIFSGSISDMHRQIGNAVPIKLSFKIAETIARKLNDD